MTQGRTPSIHNASPFIFNIYELSLKELRKLCKKKKKESLKVLVMPDTHYPDHDKEAVECMLKFAEDYKPDVFIHLGDFFEMGYVSPHDGARTCVELALKEITAGTDFLINEMLPRIGTSQNYFTVGNHEIWLDRILEKKLPDVPVPVELTSEHVCRFKEHFQAIPHNQFLKIGNLHFTHGLYTSKHHAAKMIDVVGASVMYGHLETTQQFTGVGINGVKSAYCCGTMRDKDKAIFLRKRPVDWIHAFGIVEFHPDSENFTVMVPHIIEGKTSIGGKLYDGTV